MQRVHNVLGLCHRIGGDLVNILRPCGRPHDYYRVGIVFTDHGDHLVGVSFYVRPARSVRLVAYLIDNVYIVLVFLGHPVKKVYRVRLVYVRVAFVKHMPVDYDVHTKLGAGFDSLAHKLFKLRLVSPAAIAVFMRVHGDPEYVGAPVVPERFDRVFIYILRKPLYSVSAYTLELEFLSVLVYEVRALDRKRPVVAHRSSAFKLRRHIRLYRLRGRGRRIAAAAV